MSTPPSSLAVDGLRIVHRDLHRHAVNRREVVERCVADAERRRDRERRRATTDE
jgi:hypothetical protein